MVKIFDHDNIEILVMTPERGQTVTKIVVALPPPPPKFRRIQFKAQHGKKMEHFMPYH